MKSEHTWVLQIQKAIQKNIIHIIHMHSTNNASIDVLSNRNILLETMNKFQCKSKTFTLLIICNKITEFYLHQIISYAKFNKISIAAMVRVSSASAMDHKQSSD